MSKTSSTAPSQALLNMRTLENIKVPKRNQFKNGLETCSVESKEFQDDIFPILRGSFCLPDSQNRLEFTEACYIHSPRIQELFAQKRMELKQMNSNPRSGCDLREYYAFLPVNTRSQVEKLATTGVQIGNLKTSRLGAPESGVSLCQCADLTNSSDDGYFMPRQGWLLICKYLRGRVNHVSIQEPSRVAPSSDQCNSADQCSHETNAVTNTGNNWLSWEPPDPAPEHDCHLSLRFSHMKPLVDGPQLAFHLSQVYLFEYNADFDLQTHPRQILPYAAVAFRAVKQQRVFPLLKSTPSMEAPQRKRPRSSPIGVTGVNQAVNPEHEASLREVEQTFLQEFQSNDGSEDSRQPVAHAVRCRFGVSRTLPSGGRYLPLGITDLTLISPPSTPFKIATVELRSYHSEWVLHPLLCQPRLALDALVPWDVLSVFLFRGVVVDRRGRPQSVVNEQRELMLPQSARDVQRIKMCHNWLLKSEAAGPAEDVVDDDEDDLMSLGTATQFQEDRNTPEDSSPVSPQLRPVTTQMSAVSDSATYVTYYMTQCIDVANSRGVMARFINYLTRHKVAAKVNFGVATDTLALLIPDSKFSHSLGISSGETVDVNYLHLLVIHRGSLFTLHRPYPEGEFHSDQLEEELHTSHMELLLSRKGVRLGRVLPISHDDPQVLDRYPFLSHTLVDKRAWGEQVGGLAYRRFCHFVREQERMQKDSLFQELRKSAPPGPQPLLQQQPTDTYKVFADEQKLLALLRGEKVEEPVESLLEDSDLGDVKTETLQPECDVAKTDSLDSKDFVLPTNCNRNCLLPSPVVEKNGNNSSPVSAASRSTPGKDFHLPPKESQPVQKQTDDVSGGFRMQSKSLLPFPQKRESTEKPIDEPVKEGFCLPLPQDIDQDMRFGGAGVVKLASIFLPDEEETNGDQKPVTVLALKDYSPQIEKDSLKHEQSVAPETSQHSRTPLIRAYVPRQYSEPSFNRNVSNWSTQGSIGGFATTPQNRPSGAYPPPHLVHRPSSFNHRPHGSSSSSSFQVRPNVSSHATPSSYERQTLVSPPFPYPRHQVRRPPRPDQSPSTYSHSFYRPPRGNMFLR